MQATSIHKTRKTAGVLILAAIFLSILASLSLPSILEFNGIDQEQLSFNLPEKEIKECYDNQEPENEPMEEIDLCLEPMETTATACLNSSDYLFSCFLTHLSGKDHEISIPPPQLIAA